MYKCSLKMPHMNKRRLKRNIKKKIKRYKKLGRGGPDLNYNKVYYICDDGGDYEIILKKNNSGIFYVWGDEILNV